ncbi:MAG: NifB/NifX family molybdenum-iron cluster-binding protein [Eubacteriales bacterium]|jgi:predicted Fe-Mo cluster-binding NifX family protein
MKIAVPVENGQVFGHFGKTACFAVYQVEDGAVKEKSLLDTQGSGHSALAGLLMTQNVNVLLCGGVGQGAKDALAGFGIRVVPGVSGPVDQVVEAYLAGTLQSDPNFVCDHHHHEHGEDHECHCHS